MSNDDRVLRELAKLGLVALYSDGAWYAAKPRRFERVSFGYPTLADLANFNAKAPQNVIPLPRPLPSASSDD